MVRQTKLVIFDFDGTIADTRKTIIIAKQETMKVCGLNIASEEECALTIGLSAKTGFKKLYPELSEEELELCVSTYRNIFDKKKILVPPVLFPNVRETLDMLSERGITNAIATSRSRKSCEEFLNQMGIAQYFACVLGAEDTSLLKPNAEPVIKILKTLSIKPEESLVVGDMPVDIEMGKNAQACTCGVTYGNSTKSDLITAGADFVIDDMRELYGEI